MFSDVHTLTLRDLDHAFSLNPEKIDTMELRVQTGNLLRLPFEMLKIVNFEFKTVNIAEFVISDVETHGALSLELQNQLYLYIFVD